MIAAESVAVILLAAGASSRFGSRDKLAEPLGDLPLGLHAARTFGALRFVARIAVTRPAGPDFASQGFTPVTNSNSHDGQSGSIMLGLAEALLAKPQAVLIALADMPFVTTPHIEALLARFDDEHPIVASTDGRHCGPPALFDRSTFTMLAALSGEAGARALLQDAALIVAPTSDLADFDMPEDFDRDAAER